MSLILSTPLSSQEAKAPVDIELLINQGRLQEARRELGAFQRRTRADSARALYWQGRIALNTGAAAEGVRLLERSVTLVPSDGAAQYWLGVGYIRVALGKSKLQQARYAGRVQTALERATKYSPRMVDARVYLIQFYLRAPYLLGGNKAKALAQADTIFTIDPLRGRLARAQVAEATGDMKRAEREYLAALAEFPKDETGYTSLGGFYRRVNRYADALAVYERLLRLAPDGALAHLLIGRTLAEWGQQLDRAKSELELALSIGLGNLDAARAHYFLGTIYRKRGEEVNAKEHFDRSRALDPNFEASLAARKNIQ